MSCKWILIHARLLLQSKAHFSKSKKEQKWTKWNKLKKEQNVTLAGRRSIGKNCVLKTSFLKLFCEFLFLYSVSSHLRKSSKMQLTIQRCCQFQMQYRSIAKSIWREKMSCNWTCKRGKTPLIFANPYQPFSSPKWRTSQFELYGTFTSPWVVPCPVKVDTIFAVTKASPTYLLKMRCCQSTKGKK